MKLLTPRGVPERVNLVANLDLPPSGESYAHRVGRTGRFGTHGVAVTFVTPAELPALRRLLAGVPGAQVRLCARRGVIFSGILGIQGFRVSGCSM